MAESWKVGRPVTPGPSLQMQRRGNAMNIHPPTAQAVDEEFAWLREGNMPQSREDRVAEAVALIALIFSLGIGLVIAMLPVSAHAEGTAAAARPAVSTQR
jgi:hypothetical protein